MVRVLPVLAAIAVAAVILAPAGIAATASGSPSTAQVSTPDGSVVLPAQLWAGTTAHSDRVTAHTDVGVSVDAAGVATDARLFELTLQQRLATTETNSERRVVLADESDRLREAIGTLLEREQAAYRAYVAGEIEAQTLVRRLTRTAVAADRYHESLEMLSSELESTPRMTMPESLIAASAEVQALQAPVLNRLAAVARGDRAASPVRVSVSSDRLRVAMLDRDEHRFLVDTYDWSNWEQDLAQPIGFDTVEDVASRFANVYPWIGGEVRSIEELQPSQTGAYEVGAVRSYAQVTVWFDSRTEEVYLEHQQLDLQTLPTQTITTERGTAIQLRVARTDTSGPALIETTNRSSGAPVNASIRLDNTTVGTTGADGRLWVLPPFESSTVTATTDAEQLNATATWEATAG